MQRRDFLGLTAGVVGAAAVGSLYYRRRELSVSPLFATSTQGGTTGAGLDTTLDVTSGYLELGGRSATAFTYNNLLPGPVLSVNAGESVRIHFNNHLPEPTNLHFHGLHIPPGGRADNVFLEVPEGESALYEFVVPRDHPAGTFWYHPHLHGRTAKQVSMGLAAPFIVRGELDQIPEVAAANEHILVLQDLPGARHGMMSSMGPHGSASTETLVNGESQPTLAIAQNGLLRLRFLNASISRYQRLRIQEHPMYIKCRARDERRLIRGDEDDRVCNLLSVANTLHWHGGREAGLDLFGTSKAVQHPRLNRSQCDGIDPNSRPRNFQGGRLGQTLYRMLTGGID